MKRTIYEERRPDGRWFKVYECDHWGTTVFSNIAYYSRCTEPGCNTIWVPDIGPAPTRWAEVTDSQ